MFLLYSLSYALVSDIQFGSCVNYNPKIMRHVIIGALDHYHFIPPCDYLILAMQQY